MRMSEDRMRMSEDRMRMSEDRVAKQKCFSYTIFGVGLQVLLKREWGGGGVGGEG